VRDPAKHRRSLYDVPVQAKFKRGHPNVTHWIGSEEYPVYYQVEWVAGALSNWPYSKAPVPYINAVNADKRLMLQCVLSLSRFL
jgi:hypothetical protein